MKKKVLKWWVEEILIAIFLMGIGFIGFDSDSILGFIISKVIGLLISYVSFEILYRYGKDWR